MYATCQRPVGSLFNKFIHKWCRDWYILFRPLSKCLESPLVGDSEIRVRNLPSKFWVEISPALKQSLIVSVYWDAAYWVVIFNLCQYESSDRPNSVGSGIVKLHSLAHQRCADPEIFWSASIRGRRPKIHVRVCVRWQMLSRIRCQSASPPLAYWPLLVCSMVM